MSIDSEVTRMKCFKAVRVGHKIKLEPMDDLMRAFSSSGKRKSIKIIHKVKMKPMKIWKKLMGFWG
jgi:hypothetical protein